MLDKHQNIMQDLASRSFVSKSKENEEIIRNEPINQLLD